MKSWHISDVHLSFDKDWNVIKPMHLRKWAVGVWTYQGYLEKMAKFGTEVIQDEDFVYVTGDVVHDMKEDMVLNSLSWLRHHIRGTLVICRGNHDKFWQPGKMRQKVSHLPNLYLIDEGEIITIGPYTIGCYSNHGTKTQDFSFVDGRYLETAIRTSKQASEKNTIGVMMSHYPVNKAAAEAIGKTRIKAYLSGHIHCTSGLDATSNPDGTNFDWYDQSAAQTDDLTFGNCFFSTGTTDVVLVRCKQSFKELKCLEINSNPAGIVQPADELIVLCGLPGSGKSVVAKDLETRGYLRVNQDELGGRKTCYRVVEAALKAGNNVVVDRCNFDDKQRKVWIDLAKQYKVKNIRAIQLDVSPDLCIERATARKDHPTITGAEAATRAVNALHSAWKNPTTQEGFHEVEIRREGQSHNR